MFGIHLKPTRVGPNNAINADGEKRHAFIAPPFTAGYGER